MVDREQDSIAEHLFRCATDLLGGECGEYSDGQGFRTDPAEASISSRPGIRPPPACSQVDGGGECGRGLVVFVVPGEFGAGRIECGTEIGTPGQTRDDRGPGAPQAGSRSDCRG